MKFSILALTAAVPALAAVVPASVDTTEVVPTSVPASVDTSVDTAEVKRANCKLTLKWIKNWHKNALRRYRVQLITTPRNDDHIHKYCDILKRTASGIQNVQCFWTDGMYVIDDSQAEGKVGHDDYVNDFSYAAHIFELSTGCDIEKSL
ncbi:uncharacterized protein B0J16DRAFT_325810 [Fusarium flagelliforme]|uniref:uncharacterized protein n=1 Tax=Fusarium flagelliforme TaxID=2675880 RepID=UPI001E8DB224|nr:uncharacterized protein B0J16DRAFT_325810 [Fusarium flagelliforme]KAH7196320.1 hypothetical protein B0J16DRAFT_325810 [Fusarium flagelliforme]